MSERADHESSPVGSTAAQTAVSRARRSQRYRDASREYDAIRELRARNPLAAHIRERRYELGLTQQEVAERAGTAHSFIARVEKGTHYPTLPVLKRILAVLDEEIMVSVIAREDGNRHAAIEIPDLIAV